MAVPLCLAISAATTMDLSCTGVLSIHLNRQAELFKTRCFYLCCHDNVVHQVCPTQSATLQGMEKDMEGKLTLLCILSLLTMHYVVSSCFRETYQKA